MHIKLVRGVMRFIIVVILAFFTFFGTAFADISNTENTNTLSEGFGCSNWNNYKSYEYLGQHLSGKLSQVDIKIFTPGPVYYGKRVTASIYEGDSLVTNSVDAVRNMSVVWQSGDTFFTGVNIDAYDGVVEFKNPQFGLDYDFLPNKHYYLVLTFYTSDGGGLCQGSYLYGSTDSASYTNGEYYSDPFVKDIYFSLHGLDISSTTNDQTGESVLFFPGVMGSRLYENVVGSDREDWVTTSDANQAGLVLDSGGKSVKQIYTKDDTQSINDEAETGIVDEATAGVNIYNSFINDLRNWKVDGTIKDYAFIPYDWRLSLEDIVADGATTTAGNLSYTNSQDFSESYILKKLNELASKSAHITLIGHSNGGLVIKALVQKLKDTNNPLYYKIDKIIFVAVPQVGTPDAIATLLHGTDLGPLGLAMSAERSRQLTENMPAVYNLLPSASYFTTVSPSFEIDKVVTFDADKGVYASQISKYGNYVSNKDELRDYVLGGDGRTKPSYSDTNSPSVGNGTLYTQAEAVHNVLDSWQPASTTKVIQIAGWGEDTLSGITDTVCRDISVQGFHKCIKPKWVVDGDGTVVVPSALWMSTSNPNVERWWVNLKTANTIFTKKRIHRDILEVQKLEDFIKSKLVDSNFDDLTNIVVNNAETLLSGNSRLHYTLHSPLTLGVTDSQGHYSGLDPVTKQFRDEIQGVTYKVIGDTQFVSVPSDMVGKVILSGYDSGSFSLDVEKQTGNSVVESLSFQGVPSSTTTKAFVDIAPHIASSTLSVDINGDGQVDKSIKSSGEAVVIYDNTPPEISMTYSTTTNSVVFGGIDQNPVIMTVSTSTVTATDTQSNKTVILLNKFQKASSEAEFSFSKIVRNNSTTTLPNTEVQFEVSRSKAGTVSEFESSVKIGGKDYLTLKYSAEKKTTAIKELKNGVYVTISKSGLVIERIVTTGSGVKFVY